MDKNDFLSYMATVYFVSAEKVSEICSKLVIELDDDFKLNTMEHIELSNALDSAGEAKKATNVLAIR